MKILKFLCILALTLVSAKTFAQDPNISVWVQNGTYLSARIYQFDVMIKATGSTSSFDLRTFQAGLYVNSVWVNGGTLSVENASTFSDMSGSGYNGVFQWNPADQEINCSVNFNVVDSTGCISTSVNTTPLRVSRIQITNSIDFACATPDIKFNYVANADPLRLRTSFSWRAVGCTTNYDMFYPGRTFNGTATYNGEVYSGSDPDGKSPVGSFGSPGFCQGELTIKAYLEGFYVGLDLLNPALFNSGISHANTEQADSITIELRPSGNPSGAPAATFHTILYANGEAHCLFNLPSSLVGNSYWIVFKHRNAIETWSAAPVLMAGRTTYDFTNAQNKAYGNNLVSTLDNQAWAIYSGDISDAGSATIGIQDGVIESQDYADMENAVYYTLTGYVFQDITGDGVVESADYSIIENNVSFTIFAQYP